MKLENILQEYLDWCLEEKSYITVETSFYRNLTEDELNYINEKLKPLGHYIVCFPCDTCKENTDGKDTFHLDRLHYR